MAAAARVGRAATTTTPAASRWQALRSSVPLPPSRAPRPPRPAGLRKGRCREAAAWHGPEPGGWTGGAEYKRPLPGPRRPRCGPEPVGSTAGYDYDRAVLRARHALRLSRDFAAYAVVNRAWWLPVLTLVLALATLLIVVGQTAAPVT